MIKSRRMKWARHAAGRLGREKWEMYTNFRSWSYHEMNHSET